MIAAGVCAAAVIGLLVAERRDSRAGVWLFKPLAAAAFLAAALGWGALDSGYGRWIGLGLVLCALGDVLLIPREKPRCFQGGIAAFLLGHVAYAIAFVGGGQHLAALVLAGIAMALFAWRVLSWLSPHVPPDFVVPVRAYVAVISSMVVCAVAGWFAGGSTLALVGAVGFAASDLAVARDRFVSPGFENGAWGLPTYFGAQLLLALSVTTPPA